MANKQLTAKVRLNTTQAERKLKRMVESIDAINRAANKQNTAYNQVNSTLNNTVKTAEKIRNKTDTTTKSTKQWANAVGEVNKRLNGSSRSLGMIGGKLKGLINTYLGVMGMGAIINTSDMITSSENKLNYINGGDTALTRDAMDKMYASSQKVRMSYGDMMSNVSKSMALAGDAFDNNTDKAIRFQEIMAEAYAVGGASAQEMSSSMYQLIQALGSGTLAGDELRSVREGAPLAYKAIEEFAQGVYNCEDSLKDMASQGMITAELVTAAIMNSGDELDKAFAQTEQTFAQTWEQIKNSAIYAFKPISEALRKSLNEAIDNGLLQKVETVCSYIAKAIMIIFKLISNVISWIADNWDWLKHVIVGILIAIISYLVIKTGVAIFCAGAEFIAWAAANSQLLAMLAILFILIAATLGLLYVFYLWRTGAIDTCQAVTYALLIVGAAILLIGIIVALVTGNVVLLVIGVVILLLAVIFTFFEQISYGLAWLAGWIVNIVFGIVNIIFTVIYLLIALIWSIIALIVNIVMGCVNVIGALIYNGAMGICNVVMGVWNVIQAICENIGIAFQNAWAWANSTFWEFVADLLDGLGGVADIIDAIAEALGADFSIGDLADDFHDKAEGYKQIEYVSVSDAWDEGLNTFEYKDIGEAWSNGWDTMSFADFGQAFELGKVLDYVDPDMWASDAGAWASGLKGNLNIWGEGITDNISEKLGGFNLDDIGEKLGLNFDSLTGFPTEGVGDLPLNFDPTKQLENIDDNTSKMADAMDLTSEDVEYLRKIAALEWKKEYTIADISVDMTNNNTINGETDLDGIVTKLTDKLYEELSEVADGVYAY